MITFVDTIVLLDVFLPDPKWGHRSKQSLEEAFRGGALVTNRIVYAELAPRFETPTRLDAVLQRIGVRIVPLDGVVAFEAGRAWREYRAGGGKRDRILADFLIGAHARRAADRLLTRDRGFYSGHFQALTVVYAPPDGG